MSDDSGRPRRRWRGEQPAAGDAGAAGTADPAPAPEPARPSGHDPDRGWRDLTGNSPSQVGTSGALRARDVCRPSADDLAAAERDLLIVRRHWQPPAEQPPPAVTGGR